jgi:hypothetical protein
MLTFQFKNKSYRPFLRENFLLQKVCTKFYIEQDLDPDPHFSQGSDWARCSGKSANHYGMLTLTYRASQQRPPSWGSGQDLLLLS